MGRLSGKVALISGAARGMGAAEARLFAREGAQVVVADVLADELSALAKSINVEVGREAATPIHLDVTEAAQWNAAIDFTLNHCTGIDILVNNAGLHSSAALEDADEAEWNRLVAVNQKGVWLGMRAVAPAMRKRGGGSIVNISSIAGIVGTPVQTIYHATKGAVRLLTKAAAANLGPDNIRVNSVHPGAINTAITSAIPAEDLAIFAQSTPLRRIGEPDEVALVVLFLATDESSFVTGAEYVVDGGVTCV